MFSKKNTWNAKRDSIIIYKKKTYDPVRSNELHEAEALSRGILSAVATSYYARSWECGETFHHHDRWSNAAWECPRR